MKGISIQTCPKCNGSGELKFVTPNWLTKSRIEKGLTLEELGKKTGYSVGHLSDCEHGRRKTPQSVVSFFLNKDSPKIVYWEDLLDEAQAEQKRLESTIQSLKDQLKEAREIAWDSYSRHTCRQCSSDACRVYYFLEKATKETSEATG